MKRKKKQHKLLVIVSALSLKIQKNQRGGAPKNRSGGGAPLTAPSCIGPCLDLIMYFIII